MIIHPFTVICFLSSLVLFATTCTAVWWGIDERRENLRLKRKLREARQQRDEAERSLATYRQWADDHVQLAVQPTSEDQEQ